MAQPARAGAGRGWHGLRPFMASKCSGRVWRSAILASKREQRHRWLAADQISWHFRGAVYELLQPRMLQRKFARHTRPLQGIRTSLNCCRLCKARCRAGGPPPALLLAKGKWMARYFLRDS